MNESESQRRTKGPKALNEQEWNALLSALDSNRERAAKKYETARRGLISIFRWRGLWNHAEDLADRTLDVLARRLLEKQASSDPIQDVYSYMMAIARKLTAEAKRRPRDLSLEDLRQSSFSFSLRETDDAQMYERKLAFLRKLVQQLPDEERLIITEYYEHSGSARIAHRVKLAKDTARSGGALRMKALRIRHFLSQRLLSRFRA